jgi:hypothetical protein
MWPNPTRMTDEVLEAELNQVEAKIADADANGSKIGQLQARLFRLKSEKAFRQSKMEEPTIGNPADEISQREKRRILAEDRQVRSTYLQHAESAVDEDRGGRYAATGSSPRVIGASPISYPQQPTNSPWHHDPVGDEPSLGYSVEDHDAVGERHERAGSAVPVEPTNRMDTADGGSPAAEELDRHVITPPVAGPTSKGFRRRM